MANLWDEKDIEFLKINYPQKGKLFCVKALNKREAQVRSMAAKLNLRINQNSEFFKEFQKRAASSKVGKKRPDHSELMKRLTKEGRFDIITGERTEEQRKNISEKARKRIAEKGHPRGMLGKTHTQDIKDKLSERTKRMWANPNSKVNSLENKEKRSKLQSEAMIKRLKENPQNQYSRVKKGKITIADKTFFARSRWEANVAAYLQYLKDNELISDWHHEAEEYRFEQIKRGVMSYLPDFKVTRTNGTFYLIEVKGYMDDKSKTKLNRMKKYFPEVLIDLIEAKRYKELQNQSYLFKWWGMLD
jgi:hypothetical protein